MEIWSLRLLITIQISLSNDIVLSEWNNKAAGQVKGTNRKTWRIRRLDNANDLGPGSGTRQNRWSNYNTMSRGEEFITARQCSVGWIVYKRLFGVSVTDAFYPGTKWCLHVNGQQQHSHQRENNHRSVKELVRMGMGGYTWHISTGGQSTISRGDILIGFRTVSSM